MMPSPAGLLTAAQAPYDRRYTVGGRALHKHGSRPGSVFPPPSGTPGAMNALAQQIVSDIINNPRATTSIRHMARYGQVTDIRASDGRGVRYDGSGRFIGFLEPAPPS